MLGAAKDQHHLHFFILQQMREQRHFEMLVYLIDKLGHALRRIRALADLHNLRRTLKLMRERFDLLRQRGRKHQRLPLLRQLIDDSADVRQESHVQHAVSLIQHEILKLGEICTALLHQIEQTTRASDDDVTPGTQRVLLRLFADTTVNFGNLQRQMPGVSHHVLLDLRHQFTRGRQHEHTRTAALALRNGIRGQTGQDRQGECGSLAGAGLRDADDITTRDHYRNRRSLNRGGFRITGFFDGSEDVRVEAESFERHVPPP